MEIEQIKKIVQWQRKAIEKWRGKNFPEKIYFTTARMGSCHCGDCYCIVYRDGTVQYDGKESWQQSARQEWRPYREYKRSYGSTLGSDDYAFALKAFKDGHQKYKKILVAYLHDMRKVKQFGIESLSMSSEVQDAINDK